MSARLKQFAWTISPMTSRIVVVGGSLGGLRAAEQLRSHGWSDELTVVGAEPHPPYNRPPLSKSILLADDIGESTAEAAGHPGVALRRRATTADVTWLTGVTIIGADLAERVLFAADGRELAYDGLVVATGLRPRRLPIPGFARQRHVLRTLDDAVALRTQLRPEASVVVVGGGFIGCEVAAGARARGCRVTVVEPMRAPMVRPLGDGLAAALRALHERRGVRFALGRSITNLVGRPDVPDELGGVVLDDGTRLGADVLVEAVGSRPNVDWLAGNGLDLSDGVLCDNHMRVEGRAEMVGVGDVARFCNPRFDDEPRRVEHWCVPGDTANRAASTLVGGLHATGCVPDDSAQFAPLPEFWSDQFGVRVSGFGRTDAADRTEILEGNLESGWESTGVAVGYFRNSAMTGVVTAGGTPALRLKYKSVAQTLGKRNARV